MYSPQCQTFRPFMTLFSPLASDALSHREGNGTPLQCSCLEHPKNGGAWWAAVYGVTQSQTQLKRLSSSSHQCFSTFPTYMP